MSGSPRGFATDCKIRRSEWRYRGAPEEIGIAPDLLGHADLQTTQKHYIAAVGMKAHARVQEMIAARRRAATSRDSPGTSGA
jgi:integrase